MSQKLSRIQIHRDIQRKIKKPEGDLLCLANSSKDELTNNTLTQLLINGLFNNRQIK